jgi:hypothetical protein
MALCLGAAADDGTKWQEYRSKDGKLSVQFPPGEVKTQTQAAGGLKMTMHLVEQKDAAYGVAFADFPPGTPFSYDGAIKGMAASNDGTVTQEKDWNFAGVKGKEVEMKIKKPRAGFATARIIVINDRMYQVLAIGTGTTLDNADVKKFMASFKLDK